MSLILAKTIFIVGTIVYIAIRAVFVRSFAKMRVVKVERAGTENALLAAVAIGTILVPIIYIATPVFSFADYSCSSWSVCIGASLWAIATVIFWKSHKDLGREWSVALALKENHRLITTGIYAKIRHPMYLSIWGFVIAQAFLLPNWIAGASGLITFAVLYFSRIGAEERMLRGHFGQAYNAYCKRTGRLLPKIGVHIARPDEV
jgi:protein-S-isoprenylcysteine O-methyltransferase Ste14